MAYDSPMLPLLRLYVHCISLLQAAAPLMLLAVRLWMASIIWAPEHPLIGVALPVLLALGLASRLSALGLMAAILAHESADFMYQLLLLGVVVFLGPGKLSADFVIRRRTLHESARIR